MLIKIGDAFHMIRRPSVYSSSAPFDVWTLVTWSQHPSSIFVVMCCPWGAQQMNVHNVEEFLSYFVPCSSRNNLAIFK